jgi:hypothetical protein
MKTTTHTHNTVILSCKRGEFLTNITQGADGKKHLFFAADKTPEARDFASCYTAKELADLAESYGPDFVVQPIYKTVLHVERAMGHLPVAFRLVEENHDDATDWLEVDAGSTDDWDALAAMESAADEVYEYGNLVAGTDRSRSK